MTNLAFMVFQMTKPTFSRSRLWDKDFNTRCLLVGAGGGGGERRGDGLGKGSKTGRKGNRTGYIKDKIILWAQCPGASGRQKGGCLQLVLTHHLQLGTVESCWGWVSVSSPALSTGPCVTSVWPESPSCSRELFASMRIWVLRGNGSTAAPWSWVWEAEICRGKMMESETKLDSNLICPSDLGQMI